ncbi:hypothetical protein FKM82_024622 [Ascaphus truei]
MHYDTCGTACPLTCDNYRQPLICTKDCKTGCFCNDGFVQLSNGSSICVEKNQCPVCKELGCEGKAPESIRSVGAAPALKTVPIATGLQLAFRSVFQAVLQGYLPI